MKREQKPIQSYNLPELQNLELVTKDSRYCAKAKKLNDEREKDGKFYVLEGIKPKIEVFVPKDENVKEYLSNYAKKLNLTPIYRS